MANYTFDEKLVHVRAFFRDYIHEFILKDIQVLTNLGVPEGSGGACTAPLAMAVFSAMDLLGDLTRRGMEKKQTDRTWANIKHFLNNWMKREDEVYEYLLLQQPLIGLFRRGLFHRFFPIGCGITRHHAYDNLFHGDENCLVLNVQELAADFIGAVEELSEKVEDGRNVDLIETIHEKLCAGILEYNDKIMVQIPDLVTKINPQPLPEFARTEISGSLSALNPERRERSMTTSYGILPEAGATFTGPPPDWTKSK